MEGEFTFPECPVLSIAWRDDRIIWTNQTLFLNMIIFVVFIVVVVIVVILGSFGSIIPLTIFRTISWMIFGPSRSGTFGTPECEEGAGNVAI